MSLFRKLFSRSGGEQLPTHADGDIWPPADLLTVLARETGGAEVRAYFTQDFGRAKDERGVSIKVPRAEARGLVQRLRSSIGPGLMAWEGTDRDLAKDAEPGVEVVVAPASSIAEAIMLANVDPVNYGLNSADVAEWVRTRQDSLGLDLIVANTESLVMAITKPFNALSVARQVAEFCPDSLHTRFSEVQQLAEWTEQHKVIDCWWD